MKTFKAKWKIVLAVLIAVLLLGGLAGLSWPKSVSYVDQELLAAASTTSGAIASPSVMVDDLEIPVELAISYEEIQKGLSGRASLAEDGGLLFIFSKPSIYRFWMPDMHFPIDIIWINDGKIVGLHHQVSNDFDPANPVFYYAPVPARYVLEVNAGFAKKHGLAVGDSLEFKNIKIK